MQFSDYLNVLRKRWRVILVTTILVTGVAALVTFTATKQYQARIRFFVSTTGSENNAQLSQGSVFTQQRVKSYVQVITSPAVMSPVAQKVQTQTGNGDVTSDISATIPLDTVLIDVRVTDPDPNRARLVATAIGEVFPTVVKGLESVEVQQGADPKTAAVSPVRVSLIQTAIVQRTPVSPQPKRNLPLGVGLGLLFGALLAFLRDRLDNAVHTPDDVKALTDKTLLGTIAQDPDAALHPLIVQVDPSSTRSEAFRSLRTNLQFVELGTHPRSIVVTSSVAGEGKSTTTANLASTLAAGGLRVCAIEGDLRRPKMLEYMGLEGGVGLTDVLIGRAALDDFLQPFGSATMRVLGAGSPPPNPSELLGSPLMEKTLRDLEERFDIVIIDAPPLLPVTDAAVLSTRCSGTILVVGSGVVDKGAVEVALEKLETVNANVLGVVLNRLPMSSGKYGYGSAYYYTPQTEEPTLSWVSPRNKKHKSASTRSSRREGGRSGRRRSASKVSSRS